MSRNRSRRNRQRAKYHESYWGVQVMDLMPSEPFGDTFDSALDPVYTFTCPAPPPPDVIEFKNGHRVSTWLDEKGEVIMRTCPSIESIAEQIPESLQ